MNSVKLSDGRRMFFREAGSGEPLVLLHGWSMSSAVFQEVMPLLSEDFRVLVPDLAGHGQSDAFDSGFSLDDLAADIEAWLKLLDVGALNLLGWSLGGQVALKMTLRKKVAVVKLILESTTPLFVSTGNWPHGLPPAQVRAMDRQMQRHYQQSMGEFFRLMFEGEKISQSRFQQIVRFAVRDGVLPRQEIARQGLTLLGQTDLRPFLADLDLPVLVHFGDRDLITAPSACRYLADQIKDAVAVGWPGIGHAPFLSRPDATAELWREFLK